MRVHNVPDRSASNLWKSSGSHTISFVATRSALSTPIRSASSMNAGIVSAEPTFGDEASAVVGLAVASAVILSWCQGVPFLKGKRRWRESLVSSAPTPT